MKKKTKLESTTDKKRRLLNIDEISHWLGFSKSQIYHWSSMEMIPTIKIGKHLRFDPIQIQKWLESRYNPLAKELSSEHGAPKRVHD